MKAFVAIALIGAVACGGCALAPVAALGVAGNVVDIGSATFGVGTEVFNGGRLESVEFCPLDQGDIALRWMLNDLRLKVDRVEDDKGRVFYHATDETGAWVEVEALRRTAALCQFRVNVGWFGSEAYARLILKSVRGRLPAALGRPTTLPGVPVDLNVLRPLHQGTLAEPNH